MLKDSYDKIASGKTYVTDSPVSTGVDKTVLEKMAYEDMTFDAMFKRAELIVNYAWTPSEEIKTHYSEDDKCNNTYIRLDGSKGITFKKGLTVFGVPYHLRTNHVTLAKYAKIASSNFYNSNMKDPQYGSCCAGFVAEVFGKSYLPADKGNNVSCVNTHHFYDWNVGATAYYNNNSVIYQQYSSSDQRYAANLVKAGDALRSAPHIIWIYKVDTANDKVIYYEQTPPVAVRKEVSYSTFVSMYKSYNYVIRPNTLTLGHPNYSYDAKGGCGYFTTWHVANALYLRKAASNSTTGATLINSNEVFYVDRISQDGIYAHVTEVEGDTSRNGWVKAELIQHAVSPLPFKDVKRNSWYEDPVLRAYTNGITAGVSADKFGVTGAEQYVTRVQLVTFLWRLMGSPKADSANFSDADKNSYYYDELKWAYSIGFRFKGKYDTNPNVFGVKNTDGTYRKATREETVYAIWFAVGKPSSNANTPFNDIGSVDPDYVTAVRWVYSMGITSGTSLSTFSPTNILKRTETVTFLCRLARLPK